MKIDGQPVQSASATTDAGRPLVSVLIVNYHSTGLLTDCLDALASNTIARQLQVIVVDNASPDFDAVGMASRYPWVLFLPQRTNTTFTGGNNIACGYATGRYVLLLNPDTRVEPKGLEAAVRRFETQPGIAALGAYLVDADGRLQRYYRRFPRAVDVPAVVLPRLFRRLPLGRRYMLDDVSFSGVTPVPQPPGAFLMIPRALCPDPILDPGYFNFFSDVELCSRLSVLGSVVVADDVRCFHARGMAGIRTSDPVEQLRLQHDMTWGVRRYFSRRAGRAGRLYVNSWLGVSWSIRVANALLRRPRAGGQITAIALAAMRGRPPKYG